MSVALTPEGQLGFHRPYTQLVKRTLTVANPNDRPVMFKVKTTAPKQYCVRPNSGRIEPNERLEVQVLLQPMKEDPPLSAKCRDKFLVQSAVIPKERDTLLMSELWQIVEKEDRENIHEQKIRCVYLPPNEEDGHLAPPSAAGINGVASSPSASPDSGRSPVANGIRSSPLAASESGLGHDDSFQAASSTLRAPSSGQEPAAALDKLSSAAPDAPLAGAAAAASGAAVALGLNSDTTTTSRAPAAGDVASSGTSEASLRKQLADARSEIESLKTQLKTAEAGPQLRQRNVGAAVNGHDTKPVIGHETATVEGVPPQVVMGIALGVFVITWLFF